MKMAAEGDWAAWAVRSVAKAARVEDAAVVDRGAAREEAGAAAEGTVARAVEVMRVGLGANPAGGAD